MSNKAQALALLSEDKLPQLDIATVGNICRKHLLEIQRLERTTALRAIVLGVTLWKVRFALAYGKWIPWQQEYLSFGKSQVNYIMRLALVFLIKSRATKVELRAMPSDSVELAPKDELSRALLSRLEKFVGDCSLNELLVKHGIKGVTRDNGDESEAGAGSAEGGEQLLFTEIAGHFYSLRQNLCRRETILRCTPDQLDAAKRELEEIRASFLALYAEARGTRS